MFFLLLITRKNCCGWFMWNVKIKCKKVRGNVNNVINKMLNIM